MNRDAQLLTIRPESPAAIKETSALESFQNQTLWPILKLQHPLMLTLVSGYVRKYCPTYAQLQHAEKRSFVHHVLRRDSRPQHMLVGMVVGHFTEYEFAFFEEHESEVRNRLVNLCIEMVLDQL
ncbi:MAG: hypothetical protein ACE5G0_19735 [Rhodothermales bacterium]